MALDMLKMRCEKSILPFRPITITARTSMNVENDTFATALPIVG